MLTKAKTPKKKIILYVIIIGAMLAGNFYIYYSNNSSPPSSLIDDLYVFEDEEELGLPLAKDVSLSQAILEHNVFLSLEKIGDWPVVPTNLGKADPFAPFAED